MGVSKVNVYSWTSGKPNKEYAWLRHVRRDIDWPAWFGDGPLASRWHTPELEKLEPDRRKPIPDNPYHDAMTRILSPHAVEVLGDTIRRAGELLPVVCEGREYFAANITLKVPCLDLERSQIKRFPSSGNVWEVSKYVFKAAMIPDVHVFGTPEIRAEIFVTEPFRQLVLDAKLTGFGFRLLWSGERES